MILGERGFPDGNKTKGFLQILRIEKKIHDSGISSFRGKKEDEGMEVVTWKSGLPI
jgi:hypothetical protein